MRLQHLLLISVILISIAGNPGQTIWAHTSTIVITVNTALDELNQNGNCSLREAIRAANFDMKIDACPAGSGDDILLLPSNIYTLTLAGANEDVGLTGDLDIIGTLSIIGAGAGNTIIDGNGTLLNERVFEITNWLASVNFSELSIRNGKATGTDPYFDGGGGIHNRGELIVTKSALYDNRAAGDGGGISNWGTLTLINSVLTNNHASGGGGIANRVTATVVSSTLSQNDAGAGGGINNDAGTLTIMNSRVLNSSNGGGIFNSGNITVENSVFSGNRQYTMCLWGGGIGNYAGSLTVTGSVFSDNVSYVPYSPCGSGGGGGIFNNRGILRVTSSVFTHNASSGGSGIYNHYGTATISSGTFFDNSGGGITNGGNLSLTRSTVYSNTDGGILNFGWLTLTNSTVSGNQGGYPGGGVFNTATLILSSATIVSNTAYEGGGLFNDDADSSVISLENSLVAYNTDTNHQSPDCAGTLTSQGYNLIENVAGCIITGTLLGNQTGVEPLLGPSQNNGGSTLTHALLSGSPAIDAGNPAGCKDESGNILLTDQRGFPRAVDGDGDGSVTCDIGAYELWIPSQWFYLPIISLNHYGGG